MNFFRKKDDEIFGSADRFSGAGDGGIRGEFGSSGELGVGGGGSGARPADARGGSLPPVPRAADPRQFHQEGLHQALGPGHHRLKFYFYLLLCVQILKNYRSFYMKE